MLGKKKIQKPNSLSPDLIRKIRTRDKKTSVEDLIRFHLFVDKTHREIAGILVKGINLKTLKEDHKKVGPLLGLSYEEYWEIWRGYGKRT